MTKGAALQSFFDSIMTAYAASAVPDDATLPYLTYDLITSAWGGGEVGLTVNMWFRTTSEKEPNAAVDKLSKAIGLGGVQLPCDDGIIWLKRGSPWAQSLTDETDKTIKRRYINVTAEYLTTD